VSLATTDGRVEADYRIPDDGEETPHAEYLFSDDYELTGAELHRKHGEWQLHIRTKAHVRLTRQNRRRPRTERNGTERFLALTLA
jgi:hypothetical protein